MEDNHVTCDTIMDYLKRKIEAKESIAPGVYLDATTKLAVLVENETDKLYELQQEVAKLKVLYIEQDKSATEARIRVEASPLYKMTLQQKAKIDRITETIRIWKIRSRLKIDEMGY